MYRLWLGAINAEFFDSQAKTTIAHLPAVRLASLLVELPPLVDQQRSAAILNEKMIAAEQTRKAVEEKLAAINALPTALLRRAFAGEL